MTPHNEAQKDDIAKVVLMPGDPLRAKYIADNFMEDVKLVNSVRNMFGYTGTYKGKKITVFTYKPKKSSSRKLGHRQPYTKVQIENIALAK